MSKKEVQTVEKHCNHEDCIYRRQFDATNECCYYAAVNCEVRGCKISECTRYTPGRKVSPRMTVYADIYWEYEVEDEN